MTLFDLKKNESATVSAINFGGAAHARLLSLGVKEGENIKILSFSLFKSAVLVSCGYVRIGIRKSLAQKIEVQK